MNYQLATLSVSKVNSFIDCPYHFYLCYVVKRPPEFDSEYARIGKALHSILEYINKEIQMGIIKQADSHLAYIESKVKEYKLSDIYTMKFCMYIASYLNQIVPLFKTYTIIGIEKKIDVDIELNNKLYKFIGYIDIVFLNQDKVIYLDYKSKQKDQQDVSLILTRDVQIQSYGMIISKFAGIQRGYPVHLHFRGTGLQVEKYGHIHFIDKDQSCVILCNNICNFDEMYKRFGYWVSQIEQCITNEYFPRKCGGLCAYCDQKMFCLGGQVV